jgi:hypothetical protein
MVLLSASQVGAVDDAVGLEYRWEKGQSYKYETTDRTSGIQRYVQFTCLGEEDQTHSKSVILHVCHGVTNTGNLSVEWRDLLRQVFSVSTFIGFDKQGSVKWVRVENEATKQEIPVNAATALLGESMNIFFLPVLPPSLLKKNQVWQDGARKLRVLELAEEDRPRICKIEMAKTFGDVVDIIHFDLDAGRVVKMVSRLDDGIAEAVFVKQEAVSEVDLNTMLRDYQQSVSADDFIRAVCMPRWRNNDIPAAARRDVFRLLQKLVDENSRREIVRDAVRTDMGNVSSWAWTSVSKSIDRGENWAIEAAVEATDSKNQEIEYLARGVLQDVAGFRIGKEDQKWSEWIIRIRGALPDMLISTSPALAEQTSHKDPFVRLFALRLLSKRNYVDMEPILEKAASDSDEKVRGFATATLKKLKSRNPADGR